MMVAPPVPLRRSLSTSSRHGCSHSHSRACVLECQATRWLGNLFGARWLCSCLARQLFYGHEVPWPTTCCERQHSEGAIRRFNYINRTLPDRMAQNDGESHRRDAESCCLRCYRALVSDGEVMRRGISHDLIVGQLFVLPPLVRTRHSEQLMVSRYSQSCLGLCWLCCAQRYCCVSLSTLANLCMSPGVPACSKQLQLR